VDGGTRVISSRLGCGDCLEPARLSFASFESPVVRRGRRATAANHEIAVIPPNRISLSIRASFVTPHLRHANQNLPRNLARKMLLAAAAAAAVLGEMFRNATHVFQHFSPLRWGFLTQRTRISPQWVDTISFRRHHWGTRRGLHAMGHGARLAVSQGHPRGSKMGSLKSPCGT